MLLLLVGIQHQYHLIPSQNNPNLLRYSLFPCMTQRTDLIPTPVMDSDPPAGFQNCPDYKTHLRTLLHV